MGDPILALAAGLESVIATLRALAASRPDEWVDQARSPLGRRTHCRLVRLGKLKGSKVAGRVLVRRRDLDAFIEAHAVGAPADLAPLESVHVGRAEAALQQALARPSRRRRRAAK